MAFTFKKIMPVLDRVLIRRAETAIITKGGIVLPEKKVERSLEGIVVAIGSGVRNIETGKSIPMNVEEGDLVLMPEYGGTRVRMEDDDKEYLLFRESEILAKIIKD